MCVCVGGGGGPELPFVTNTDKCPPLSRSFDEVLSCFHEYWYYFNYIYM